MDLFPGIEKNMMRISNNQKYINHDEKIKAIYYDKFKYEKIEDFKNYVKNVKIVGVTNLSTRADILSKLFN